MVAGRLHEQRLVAYAEAMLYAQTVEARLNETLEDPDVRTRHDGADVPHENLIGAVALSATRTSAGIPALRAAPITA